MRSLSLVAVFALLTLVGCSNQQQPKKVPAKITSEPHLPPIDLRQVIEKDGKGKEVEGLLYLGRYGAVRTTEEAELFAQLVTYRSGETCMVYPSSWCHIRMKATLIANGRNAVVFRVAPKTEFIFTREEKESAWMPFFIDQGGKKVELKTISPPYDQAQGLFVYETPDEKGHLIFE